VDQVVREVQVEAADPVGRGVRGGAVGAVDQVEAVGQEGVEDRGVRGGAVGAVDQVDQVEAEDREEAAGREDQVGRVEAGDREEAAGRGYHQR